MGRRTNDPLDTTRVWGRGLTVAQVDRWLRTRLSGLGLAQARVVVALVVALITVVMLPFIVVRAVLDALRGKRE